MSEQTGVLMADGLDPAVIGMAKLPDRPGMVVVYDIDKCAEAMVGTGVDRDTAMEFLEYNTLDAWVGPGTPVFVEPCTAEEARMRLSEGGGE